MAVIKVSASLFSSVKTVGRALDKMSPGDEIMVTNGHYKETITFTKDAQIVGHDMYDTILEGTIFVPKGQNITIKNLTIKPHIQFLLEGTLLLENVQLLGNNATAILALNGGKLIGQNIILKNGQELGISAINKSVVEIKASTFEGNGKSHLFVENSTLRISETTLTGGNHAIWAKNQSKVISGTNTISHHSGTQIIIQNESIFHDQSSHIRNGDGNGLFASRNCTVELRNSMFNAHKLPQIWLQDSQLDALNCDIEDGDESGIMLRSCSEATLSHCTISNHSIANIQLTDESRLHLENSHILNSKGIGVHVRESSIANFEASVFERSKLSQLYLTDNSIATLKSCEIKNGEQLGVYLAENSNCTVIESSIFNHPNTAITLSDSEILVMESKIYNNAGNGLLALQNASITVEDTTFTKNNMPHIAGKYYTTLVAKQCEFSEGKSIYILEHSNVQLSNCVMKNSDGVQVEVNDQTKISIHSCLIKDGKGNGIKVSKDSSATICDTQILNHRLPQVVINDSSLVFKNSELIGGERNGFIIENHSEAHIQDSFISKHRYPQIWIDKHSTVELKVTQIKDGNESDIYVQNNSSLYADQCIIRNERFQFNVQAVNHSKIDLTHTIVENALGEEFYIENNSFITHKVDSDE